MKHSLGSYLRHLRTERRLSLSGLARQASVAKSTLIRWEADAHRPRLVEMEAVLRALRAAPEQIEHAHALLDAPRAVTSLPGTSLVVPTVGELLRAMRLRRGLQPEQVASSLKVSASTVSRWEGGKVALPPDQRESLLDLLGARPQEREAFRDHRLLIGGEDSPAPLEELGHRLALLFDEMQQGDHVLMDLKYLLVRSQLWPMVRRSEEARFNLSSACFNYALGLTWVGRRREAARYAEYALELLGTDPAHHENRVNMVTVSTLFQARSGGADAPSRAVERLQSILPLAQSPLAESGLYRDMAVYARLGGRTEAALEFVRQAHRSAERAEDEAARRLAQYIHAQILLDSGQAQAVLPLLQESRMQPLQQIHEKIQGVQALAAVGEKNEAHRWAVKAYALLDCYDYPQLREEMDGLTQRL